MVKAHSPFVVGVDVGASKIAAAVVDAEGHVYGRVQRPTDIRSPAMTLTGIAACVTSAIHAAGIDRREIQAVGMGIPGKIDQMHGVASLAVSLGWRNVPIKARLEAMLDLPCRIENDVRAATLGEWQYGAGAGLANLVYLSVGHGIGTGVVVNGQLHRGTTGLAGEIGHMIIDPTGPHCKCGASGCLESLVAGPAIAARMMLARSTDASTPLARIYQRLSAADVFAAAARGDHQAHAVLQTTGRYLASVIQFLILSFDPQLVVIGGGVAAGGVWLLDPVRQALADLACRSAVFETVTPDVVQLTSLAQNAGILGAASLVMPALSISM